MAFEMKKRSLVGTTMIDYSRSGRKLYGEIVEEYPESVKVKFRHKKKTDIISKSHFTTSQGGILQ